MKIIDKTPLQNEKGKIGAFQRLRGTMQHGLSWYPALEAQKVVIRQLDRVLEKGFTLIRNLTLSNSKIVEPLILIGPPGVFVLHITNDRGFFLAEGDRWNISQNGRWIAAPVNPMSVAARLARALQVYLERQGVNLPESVEPVLIASSPALHLELQRPMMRVVQSDAIKQFAASLLQARPVLRAQFVHDLADRLVTPRAKSAGLEPAPEALPIEAAPAEPQAPARARAIFHAAEEAKPFDPADLSFAFDEDVSNEVPANLRETSPSQQLPHRGRGGRMKARQWLLLAGMLLVECLVLGAFGYLILTGPR